MDSIRERTKRLDLLGGVGAVVLGAGLGALLAQWLQTYALAAALVGIAVHGFAMFQKHRLERESSLLDPAWAVTAYWLCWGILLVLVFLLLWALVR